MFVSAAIRARWETRGFGYSSVRGMPDGFCVVQAGLIAGKPAPTDFSVIAKSVSHYKSLWELACQRWRPPSHRRR
ncbi:hypothetical protein FCH79_07240 [Pseudomonas koreensis]|nr:hypothetical protein [Pseudomonas koreensis]